MWQVDDATQPLHTRRWAHICVLVLRLRPRKDAGDFTGAFKPPALTGEGRLMNIGHDECPHCNAIITSARFWRDGQEDTCPYCHKPYRVTLTDEGLWPAPVQPEDQRLRAAGAPGLPGLE